MTNSTRADILGCPIDAIDLPAALSRITAAIRTRQRLCPTALNTAKIVRMRADPMLRKDVVSSDMITADGAGIVLAAWLLGQPLPGRVAGIDLMEAIIALAAKEGFRPYLLGAKPGIAEKAVTLLQREHSGLQIAGWRDGFFNAAQETQVVNDINSSGADCLFVALPTPMKERFLASNGARLTPPVVMGVGGSFDVIAGHVARAPLWMQQAGLEWLFRLTQEPKKMAGRYLTTNTIFAFWLIRASIYRVFGHRFAPLSKV